jgi:hypothetical protein
MRGGLQPAEQQQHQEVHDLGVRQRLPLGLGAEQVADGVVGGHLAPGGEHLLQERGELADGRPYAVLVRVVERLRRDAQQIVGPALEAGAQHVVEAEQLADDERRQRHRQRVHDVHFTVERVRQLGGGGSHPLLEARHGAGAEGAADQCAQPRV